MSVFVDTSAFYTLLVGSEHDHPRVLDCFQDLLQQGRILRTTSYVVVETVALLQHRLGLEPVRDFLDKILPVISVEWVERGLHARGQAILLRQDRRRLSLVDCVSLEFIRSHGIRDVLALDPHLAEAGQLLPRL